VVALALFIDTLVYGIAVPILGSILSAIGRSSSDLGVLFGSYAIGLLTSAPIAGVISDRIGRRIPMVVGLLGMGVSSILFSFAESFWQLLVARILQGVSGGISWSVGLSMIADVYPSDQLGSVPFSYKLCDGRRWEA
jgi:MFS family permease